MSEDGHGGGPVGPYGDDWFAQPYPHPPIISAAPPPPKKVNIFATLSVVFAFVFAPVGAVLGHLGLSQIRRAGQAGHDRALVGLTLSYGFIVIAVAALIIWTFFGPRQETSSTAGSSPAPQTTATPPQQPFVTAAQLPKLVLNADEVKQAVYAPSLGQVDDAAALNGEQGVNVSPRECLSSIFAGTVSAYQHSSVRGTFTRTITGDGNDGMISLNETMSTFENTAAATQLVSAIVGDWRACAGRSVTLSTNGNPMILDVGQPVQKGTLMVLQNTLQDGVPGAGSDRVIAAKANVVIDLYALGRDLGDDLSSIAVQIMSRVPD
jgi:hypothetical protein